MFWPISLFANWQKDELCLMSQCGCWPRHAICLIVIGNLGKDEFYVNKDLHNNLIPTISILLDSNNTGKAVLFWNILGYYMLYFTKKSYLCPRFPLRAVSKGHCWLRTYSVSYSRIVVKREKFQMTTEIRKDSTNVYAIGVDWSYLRISGNSHGLTTWIKPFYAFSMSVRLWFWCPNKLRRIASL